MCGLHRHGNGGVFASTSMGLVLDAYTLGKGLGAGVFPVSAVIFRDGGDKFEAADRGVAQSHTFAGSSALAMVTAAAVLTELTELDAEIDVSARLVQSELIDKLVDVDPSLLLAAHGQGLLWGVVLHNHPSIDVMAALQAECALRRVRPYYGRPKGTGGAMMISPPLDIEAAELRELCQRLLAAVEATASRL
jgi:acetylornithine/succinyldiaminopimelate/putrescine aminotransferase